jgi:hypothetical protein
MEHLIGPGTPLYRVTRPDETWPEVVMGLGAYFTTGGRYNRPHQPTVYAADDPWVALTEGAFYQALRLQKTLADSSVVPVRYPLTSLCKLWRFVIDPPPPLIDLEHPDALRRFSYAPHMLFNPSREYRATRDLADEVRAYLPPDGSADPRPEGLKAPSVRAPRRGTWQPYQYALFVMRPSVQRPYEERGRLLDEWELTYEFQEPPPRRAVTFTSARIDWVKPRFRLGGPSTAAIPAFAGRLGAQPYRPNRWYRLIITCA